MKIWIGFITLFLSCCTPLAEHKDESNRLTAEQLSKLKKIKDSANRECYAHEMGTITLYVDLGDKPRGSMESQIMAMYAKATNHHLTNTNETLYKSMVTVWAYKNMDTINAAYKEGRELLPGHVYVGVKPKNKKEKLWHYVAGKDVAGKAPARIYHIEYTFTHSRKYKASPETIDKINEFLVSAKKNVPYYHWNAIHVKSLNGKQLSNCVVFAIDAIKAAGIDTSGIDHIRDPWYLAPKLAPKLAKQ